MLFRDRVSTFAVPNSNAVQPMSFLDHIARCNAHDMTKFVPFVVDGETAGHVRKDHLVHLERFPDVFNLSPAQVRLADGLTAPLPST